MAIRFALSGDRFASRAASIVPKSYSVTTYPAAWASTVQPAVGHLVIQDTTALLNDAVKRCVASDIPYGMVESVNSSNGTLTVIKFTRVFSMVLETATGVTAVLAHQIQANGTVGTIPIDGILRDQVKDVAAAGAGLIVSI